MKILLVSIVLLLIFSPEISFGQDLEKAQILAQREASNQALRVFDEELNTTFSTEDAFITTGGGTLLSGKAELMEYIQNAKGPKM